MTLAMLAVGIGAGVALVRAERELTRRGERRRTQDPSPQPTTYPQIPVQRVMLQHIDAAIDLLESYPEQQREDTVHEVRKSLKRVRALLRLLRPQLSRADFERENVALRDCARRLSGARDAEVMVATLDELVHRHPSGLARSSGVRRLRAELTQESERAPGVEDPALREAAIGELRGVRQRISLWRLTQQGGKKDARRLLEAGICETYATGRRRRRRARRREDVKRLHALRKSAKDLRYVAETLQGARPAGDGGPSAKGTGSHGVGRGARRARRRMRRVARRADRLGEMLGEDHDLALLRDVVRERFDGGRRKRRRLLKLIARRRRRLRRHSLELADGLYGRKPKRFVRRLRRAL